MVKTLKTYEIEKPNEEGDYIELDVLEGGFCVIRSCLGGIEEEILLRDKNILKMSFHLGMFERNRIPPKLVKGEDGRVTFEK